MNATQDTQNCNCNDNGLDQSSPAALKIRPVVDLIESDNDFVIHVEMPGVDSSGVEISLERNILSIQGTAEFSAPDGYRPVAGEAGKRFYSRSFQLTDDIDRSGIDAEVKNGVLTLKLPKSHRAKKATIAVRSA